MGLCRTTEGGRHIRIGNSCICQFELSGKVLHAFSISDSQPVGSGQNCNAHICQLFTQPVVTVARTTIY